jgi:hypothetical protein
MSETRILSMLLRMYFPRNWEFGSAFSKLRNFGEGGLNPQTSPLGTPLVFIVMRDELFYQMRLIYWKPEGGGKKCFFPE